MYTTKQIYESLGLTNPDLYSLQSIEVCKQFKTTVNLDDYVLLTHRRTGKTTRMLVDALSYISCTGNNILLVGSSRPLAWLLRDQLVDMANKLGLSIIKKVEVSSKPNTSYTSEQTFIDNSYSDQCQTQVK